MNRNGFVVHYRHILIFLFFFIVFGQILKAIYIESLGQEKIYNAETSAINASRKRSYEQKTIITPCAKYNNIEDLIHLFDQRENYFNSVDDERMDACKRTYKLVDLIFKFDLSNGSEKIVIPTKMETLVRKSWLKNDPILFEKFLRPKTLTLTNRWTFETTGINPLRALRPRQNTNSNNLKYTLDLINRTKSGCNFCDKDFTVMDSFGRIEDPKLNLYSARNSFPYTDHVGIFVPEKIHNWMEIDYETFHGLFMDIAVKWFRKVHKLDRTNTHPMMIWDIMPNAGASQVHPHIQGFLGKKKYLGKIGRLEDVLRSYNRAHQRDYLIDYIDLHILLGLGLRYRSTAILTPIDAKKDNEFIIIGSTSLSDWIRAMYLIHRTYIESLKVYCISSGMAWPSIIVSNDQMNLNNISANRFPMSYEGGRLMYARITGRGNCQSIESDISSLELYAINHLSVDPFKTFQALNKTIMKYN